MGRKTANLVVTIGYNKYGICVDTHVHRITNRWGYVNTGTPEKTEFALRDKLPRKHWKVINVLQDYYKKNGIAPMVRILSKVTGFKLKYIYELFPSGPGKGACKMAGLPKPTGCV